jgi:hypothetical protein
LLLHVFLVQLWGLNGTRLRIEGRQSLAYALIDSPRSRAAAIVDLPLHLESPARQLAAQPVIEIAASADNPESRPQSPGVDTVLPPRPDPQSPNLAPVPPGDLAMLSCGPWCSKAARSAMLLSQAPAVLPCWTRWRSNR